jgi:imidazolonepropionase-like amidohydrolase
MLDAHCHLTVTDDDHNPSLGDMALALQRPADLGRSGVTVVRDVGGRRDVTLRLSSADVDGRPQVIAAGRFFAPSGRYFNGLHVPVEPAELVAEVVREIDEGAGWIKLIGDFPRVADDGQITPDSTDTTFLPDLVRQVVHAAHSRGVRVAVHTNSLVVSALIAAGIDSVEHGVGLTAEDIQRLGARGGAWIPTLGPVVGAPPEGSSARDSGQIARSRKFVELLPLAVRSGVHILAGPMSSAPWPRKWRCWPSTACRSEDALRSASTGAQEYLGARRHDDMVTYAQDPRDDPAIPASPTAVVIGGIRVA